MFRTDSIISVADRFVVIVICGILLLNPVTRSHFKIEWLVYSQTMAYLIGALVAFVIVFSKARPIRFHFNVSYYASFLKRSLPYALLILLMATYLRIDSLLLGKLLPNGKELAGVYAQSFRIIEILSNYGYLFTIILLPVFARMLKKGESVEPLTRLSFTLLFVPAILVTVGCIVYRYEIIDLLYHEHMETSARVFGILIFSFPGICITYIFGTLLTANGSLFQLNIMAGMAVVINIVLNLILIRKFGVYGAACASMATQLFTSVYQVLLAKSIFRFGTDYKYLARFMVFTVLTVLFCLLMQHTEMEWFYSFGIYIAAGILTAFLTGLLKMKSIAGLATSLMD
jgi:O-antigen/teichoic acid export membrane protein